MPNLQSGPELDKVGSAARISRPQILFNLMKGGEWFTLQQLTELVGGSESGVSAAVRRFRRARYGGHTVNKQKISKNLFQYQLIPNKHQEGADGL